MASPEEREETGSETERESEPQTGPAFDSDSALQGDHATRRAPPSPAQAAAHERLQRGLLLRGGTYVAPSPTGSWRDGPVGVLRPSEPDQDTPARLWLVIPFGGGEPGREARVRDEAGLQVAAALAVAELPAPGVAAHLEERLGLPVVLFSLGEAQAGPRAMANGALAELRATLAYPDEALARVDVEASYQGLSTAQTLWAFGERLRQATPRVWLTPVLIGISVVVWLAQVLLAGVDPVSPSAGALFAWGANSGAVALGDEPWRLLAAGFLHVGFLHIAFNMYILWDLGPLCERLFGQASYAAVYFASLLGGSIASAAWSPLRVSAGASGAIFGLAGAVLGFVATQRGAIPPAVFERYGRTVGLFVVANLLLTGALSNWFGIDNAAHLGGLGVGAVAGAALSRPIPPRGRGGRRRGALILTVFAALAVTTLALRATPRVREARPLVPVLRQVYAYSGLMGEVAGKHLSREDARRFAAAAAAAADALDGPLEVPAAERLRVAQRRALEALRHVLLRIEAGGFTDQDSAALTAAEEELQEAKRQVGLLR